MADQVLIYADTVRSPELRHEVPVMIGDPFLYAERDGTRSVLTNVLEADKMRALGLDVHLPEEYGIDELVESGRTPDEIRDEMLLRACRALQIDEAIVPFGFPLQVADHLRANGIELRPDEDFFADRRRAKNEHEVAGIRRAQKAAEAGMEAARALLRRADIDGNSVMLDGEPLTCERVKVDMTQAFLEAGCASDEFIVAHGAQAARGHDMGSGPILAGETIVIDVWPRDIESACFADMTRTFVVGEISDEIREWHRLCKEALDRALSEIRAGVPGKQVFEGTCEIMEAAGHPTQRTKEPGKSLDEGFFHGLGHGVGLEVHEDPGMGRVSDKDLIAGDVITVEPGLYRQGFGGVRLEDLVLVTEDGAENLTDFPYDLTP